MDNREKGPIETEGERIEAEAEHLDAEVQKAVASGRTVALQVVDRRHSATPAPAAPTLPATVPTPTDLLQLALQRDTDLDRLERLMDLHLKYQAHQAEVAYTEAMTRFKAECPPAVRKNATVEYGKGQGATRYTHATLDAAVEHVTALLAKHGFTHSWDTTVEPAMITVTCEVTHVAGHTKSTTWSAPPDTSGSKNKVQAIASTVTYLERYTLLSRLGLATKDDDDDGRGGPEAPVPEGHNPVPKRAQTGIDAFKRWLDPKTAQAELERWVGAPAHEWGPEQFGLLNALYKRTKAAGGKDDQAHQLARELGDPPDGGDA